MKNFLFLFFIFFIRPAIHAQINTELRFDDPLQNGISGKFSATDINVFKINYANDAAQMQAFLQEQSQQQKKLIFGENLTSDISLSNCKWKNVNDKLICRIMLNVPGAKTLNIRLEKFHLSPSAKLFLYNKEGTVVMGPVTATANNISNTFNSSIFPGEDLVLEVSENAAEKEKSSFIISRITYGIIDIYKSILSDVGTSGSCEENVTCVLGAWHDEAKSAVRLLIKGNTLCSACLVNNTAQDGTPYVLTANHCVVGEKNLEDDISFVFFFKSRYCDSTKPVKNYKVYNQGYLRAHYYNSDFALLEMINKPDSAEQYFYAGWSRDTIQGSFAACLHFPQGDLMKYSECTLPVVDTAYGTSGTKTKKYWVRWTGTGVTEDGSSGGPLFNANKQVIGELYDGPSHCGAKGINKSDYFGGLYASWRGGGKITNRLKDWLDPLNSNATSINGAYIFPENKPEEIITQTQIKTRESIAEIFPNPAKDKIHLQIDDALLLQNKEASVSIFTAEGEKVFATNIVSSDNTIDISSLKSGIYFLKIFSPQVSCTEKLIVEK